MHGTKFRQPPQVGCDGNWQRNDDWEHPDVVVTVVVNILIGGIVNVTILIAVVVVVIEFGSASMIKKKYQ